jgi:hypothetical protein
MSIKEVQELADLVASLRDDPLIRRRLVKALARMVEEQDRHRDRLARLRKMKG